jgi:methylglutaconyl-CoA hydratase
MTNLTLEAVTISTDARGVATLTLNRPEKHNALNGALIADLRHAAALLGVDDKVRIVVLTGAECGSFCAGGDFNWFKSVADSDRSTRRDGSRELARMLADLDRLPKPLIGRINGSAYGGGTGMISVCDYSVGAIGARYGLTEVRLGLIPANISPYVVKRIGEPNSRAVMLSGALFDTERAVQIGLLTEAAAADDLDARVEKIIADHLEAAPGAVAMTKELIAFVSTHSYDDNLLYTGDRLADAWEADEGAAGIAAFLGKTTPPWRSGK